MQALLHYLRYRFLQIEVWSFTIIYKVQGMESQVIQGLRRNITPKEKSTSFAATATPEPLEDPPDISDPTDY
ncbi:hypothetical protein IC582_002920 [Cucumis melo]